MAACKAIIDSIGQYLYDSNTATSQGMIARALQNVAGEVIPWQKQGVDANKMTLQTPTAAPLQQNGLELLTFVIEQCATNDIAASRSLAQLQADFIAISTVVKNTIGPYGNPVLMVGLACLNRGTFTGAMNTVKNAYNDWLAAGADGYCDVYIDLRPSQGDPATYPNDTIHPGPTNHANMAVDLAAALVPLLDPFWVPLNYVRLAA
jgi:hypothetical protein